MRVGGRIVVCPALLQFAGTIRLREGQVRRGGGGGVGDGGGDGGGQVGSHLSGGGERHGGVGEGGGGEATDSNSYPRGLRGATAASHVLRARLAGATMLPCAPYIKSMCQSFRPLLPSSQENTPHGSPVKKVSEVRVTDVKGLINVDVIESFNDNVSVYVLDEAQARPSDVADVAKSLGSFKPESPDVTRAAKRFEKARRSEERIEEVEEKVICDIVDDAKSETAEDRRAEEEKRGARSKTTER